MRPTIETPPLELLEAGLSGLVADDVVGRADYEVRTRLPRLLAALNQLSFLIAATVGTFDARELSDVDACRTTRTWLTSLGRMSQGAASGWLARARLLRELPAVAAACRRGDVSTEHLTKIGQLAEMVGAKLVKDFDEILADLASGSPPADVAKACERILAHVDPDGKQPDPAADFDQRELTISRHGGTAYVRGRLDAEGAAALLTALDALMRPPAARPQLGVLVSPAMLLDHGDATRPAGLAAGGSADPRPARDALEAVDVPRLPEPPWMGWIGEIPITR